MALVDVKVDSDVAEMARRIAGRLGKGVSDTLQDGLIYIARAHNWTVEKDEDEQLDEDAREEVYVLWSALDVDARRYVLRLLEGEDLPELHPELQRLQVELGKTTQALEDADRWINEKRQAELAEENRALKRRVSDLGFGFMIGGSTFAVLLAIYAQFF